MGIDLSGTGARRLFTAEDAAKGRKNGRATISSRIRKLLNTRADMISLLSRYPELAPFIPDDVETPKYLDMLAARLLQQALGGGGIGLQALSIILDRHDGKLTDKLEVSGGLDSTLTVQSFREQMLSIAARTTVETVVPVDDLDTTF